MQSRVQYKQTWHCTYQMQSAVQHDMPEPRTSMMQQQQMQNESLACVWLAIWHMGCAQQLHVTGGTITTLQS